MANKQNPPGDDRSDIEFLYFKGKMRSADIQALVSGFASTRSNALPARPATKRIAAPSGNGAADLAEDVDLELVEDAEIAEEDGTEEVATAPKTPRRQRTYPTPATVEMDMEAGGKSFNEFAQEKGPKSHVNRYLVAAAWCNEYAKLETITAGHVRTCYIAADWTYNVQDPLDPFREIRGKGLGALNEANFTIGHLGLGKVKNMKDGKVSKG
jgi:hypothetical protein